jgi:hypothetical protein
LVPREGSSHRDPGHPDDHRPLQRTCRPLLTFDYLLTAFALFARRIQDRKFRAMDSSLLRVVTPIRVILREVRLDRTRKVTKPLLSGATRLIVTPCPFAEARFVRQLIGVSAAQRFPRVATCRPKAPPTARAAQEKCQMGWARSHWARSMQRHPEISPVNDP